MSKGESTKQHLLSWRRQSSLKKATMTFPFATLQKQPGLLPAQFFDIFLIRESIFAALVSPVAEEMLAMYRAGNEKGFDFLSEGRPQEMWGSQMKSL